MKKDNLGDQMKGYESPLSERQLKRLREIDKSGRITKEDFLLLPNIHFCEDWDGMAICNGTPEIDYSCSCSLELEKGSSQNLCIPKMSVKEFREKGYLQELNRQFLHPLGLALEVTVDKSDNWSITGIWDYRDDPEGMTFGLNDPDTADKERTLDFLKRKNFIKKQFQERELKRYLMFGGRTEPIPNPENLSQYKSKGSLPKKEHKPGQYSGGDWVISVKKCIRVGRIDWVIEKICKSKKEADFVFKKLLRKHYNRKND